MSFKKIIILISLIITCIILNIAVSYAYFSYKKKNANENNNNELIVDKIKDINMIWMVLEIKDGEIYKKWVINGEPEYGNDGSITFNHENKIINVKENYFLIILKKDKWTHHNIINLLNI